MVQFTHAGALLGLVGLLASFVGCSGATSGDGNEGSCDYAGKRYAVGDSFVDQDGCNQCTCREGGQVACTNEACLPQPHGCTSGGKHYDVGSSFAAPDGCNQCTCRADGEVGCTLKDCRSTCDADEVERTKELAEVQRCSTAADCGQPIMGSSCGCTRDLVARKDAELDHYLELQQRVSELCGVGGSTCDCPPADGFACIDQRCTWNYTMVEPQPNPSCQKHEGGQLCVRGTPTTDGEVLAVGDVLNVTVYSKGCFSSSCSEVQAAECGVSEGNGFEVAATFCVASTAEPGRACTDDCGSVHADCSFGQGLSAGEHQVRMGAVVVGFQVPTKLPLGGLCAGSSSF